MHLPFRSSSSSSFLKFLLPLVVAVALAGCCAGEENSADFAPEKDAFTLDYHHRRELVEKSKGGSSPSSGTKAGYYNSYSTGTKAGYYNSYRLGTKYGKKYDKKEESMKNSKKKDGKAVKKKGKSGKKTMPPSMDPSAAPTLVLSLDPTAAPRSSF